MLFHELVALFHRYNLTARARRTADFYAEQLRVLVKVLGNRDAAELGPRDLLDWKPTWHRILAVQRLYRWAVEEIAVLTVNPFARLKRPRLGKRKRLFSPLELFRLCRCSAEDLRALLLAARETAARPQELCQVEWVHLSWDGGFRAMEAALVSGKASFILLDFKAKSRRADSSATRLIPISPRLGRMLWRMAKGKALAGRIFKTASGAPWDRRSCRASRSGAARRSCRASRSGAARRTRRASRSGGARRTRRASRSGAARNKVKCRLVRALAKAKVVRRIDGETLCLYSLRHTSATRFAVEGMPLPILQELLGHTHVTTTQRYIHQRQVDLLRFWAERNARVKKRQDNGD